MKRALSRTLAILLLMVAVAGLGGYEPWPLNAAQPAAPARKAAPATALGLWSPAELAEPKDRARLRQERAVRQLEAPDNDAPPRTAPLDPPPPLPEARRGIIRRVQLPAGDRRVALTFDLCERAAQVSGYDARLVDVLRRANARATFFLGGKWMRSHPERTLQLLADPRFELGNHAWTHANMLVAPEDLRLRQVQWTAGQFELLREDLERRLAARGLPGAQRGPLALFRLPYGRGSADTARFLNSQGLAVIHWDVVGEGGKGGAQARAQAMAEAVRPGSIVLLHANAVPRDTAEVLQRLLPLLARKGYSTATVGELLAAGRPETAPEGYFSFPGDNAVYDSKFSAWGTGARLR